MNNALRRKVRQQEGREPQASAGSADSQSVKTTEKRVRCTALMVAKGSKDENAISQQIHRDSFQEWQLLKPTCKTAWEGQQCCQKSAVSRDDCSWFGQTRDTVAHVLPKRSPKFAEPRSRQPLRTEAGFQVLPRRWVVERTFGWLGRYRRLSKDYELLPEVSEAMIYSAMVRLMLNRLAS